VIRLPQGELSLKLVQVRPLGDSALPGPRLPPRAWLITKWLTFVRSKNRNRMVREGQELLVA
jgi:hypothetical protein